MWWPQGFAEEEDIALKKMVADYEKASGNKIDLQIVRSRAAQKNVAAIQTGVVPDIMNTTTGVWRAANWRTAARRERDRRAPEEGLGTDPIEAAFLYNGVAKARLLRGAAAGHRWPFHIWGSLSRRRFQDCRPAQDLGCLPRFFHAVQDNLRKQGCAKSTPRLPVTPTASTDRYFNQFMIAYGGRTSSPRTEDQQRRSK